MTFNTSQVTMANCAETASRNRWEIVEYTNELFKIRHAHSQLCLPQNPEIPNAEFNCFEHSGDGEALADSINGLVSCSSEHAATVGFVDASNPMYLYNDSCFSGASPGLGTDVGLMSYLTPSGAQLVLWGEKVLLDMPDMVTEYSLNAEWVLVDTE